MVSEIQDESAVPSSKNSEDMTAWDNSAKQGQAFTESADVDLAKLQVSPALADIVSRQIDGLGTEQYDGRLRRLEGSVLRLERINLETLMMLKKLVAAASKPGGKRCAETLFMDYHHQNKVKIKIIRIFNTYGPNMNVNDGRVVSNFIVQALKREPITIYGDGSQTRSFQYIDDLIEGMVRMMNADPTFTGPVNLGNPNEFSMLELAQTVIKLTGSSSKIIFMPLPKDDPKQRQPNIELAQEKLNGWEPTIQLEEGLLKTIHYFEKVLSEQ